MQIDINVVTVNSKKTGRDYKALQVIIGKWKKLIFVSEFEIEYIEEILEKAKKVTDYGTK